MALAGCPKSSDTADAGAPAASSSPPVASQVTLAPLDETATVPAASTMPLATETHPAATGIRPIATGTTTTTGSAKPATPSAQAQLRQCCSAIRKQAQREPNQAMQLQQAATLCDGLAAAMATPPSGAVPPMPQLDGVKALLAGVQIPPVCQGL